MEYCEKGHACEKGNVRIQLAARMGESCEKGNVRIQFAARMGESCAKGGVARMGESVS